MVQIVHNRPQIAVDGSVLNGSQNVHFIVCVGTAVNRPADHKKTVCVLLGTLCNVSDRKLTILGFGILSKTFREYFQNVPFSITFFETKQIKKNKFIHRSVSFIFGAVLVILCHIFLVNLPKNLDNFLRTFLFSLHFIK